MYSLAEVDNPLPPEPQLSAPSMEAAAGPWTASAGQAASERSVSYHITNPLSHPQTVWNARGPACQSQAQVGVGGRNQIP